MRKKSYINIITDLNYYTKNFQLEMFVAFVFVLFSPGVLSRSLSSQTDAIVKSRDFLRTESIIKRDVADATDEVDTFKRPWEINKHVCPPILCQGTANNKTLRRPIALQGGPRKFPFFNGDVVLDHEQHGSINSGSLRPPPRSSSPNQQQQQGSAGSPRSARAIVRPVTRLWPYGIVPYIIDPKLSNLTRALIREAMEHISNRTCVKFKPKTELDKDFVHYIQQPGCWSYVGRAGGEQFLSLGNDCEYLGTVIHETTHALGFWHEQSRPDRDNYVKIVKKNLDTEAADQFTKLTNQESTSREYAYDYNSIMHYGKNYFSGNGQDTIKLIGIGRTMNFKIGQRKRLSDIDVGQLNDIYNCFKKKAAYLACQSGWVKFGASCYLFDNTTRQSFFEASRICRQNRARLIAIEDDEEDEFVKNYLKYHFPSVEKWRTRGLRTSPNGSFEWYLAGSGGNHSSMDYTAWPANFSTTLNPVSLVLARTNFTRIVNKTLTTIVNFVWQADSIGTASTGDVPTSEAAYSFICEATAKIPCINSTSMNGRDYRGHLSYSNTGIQCQRWSKIYPHNHTLSATNTAEGLGDHNYCRNPNGIRSRPWCFTLLKTTPWQYCDLPICKTADSGN